MPPGRSRAGPAPDARCGSRTRARAGSRQTGSRSTRRSSGSGSASIRSGSIRRMASIVRGAAGSQPGAALEVADGDLQVSHGGIVSLRRLGHHGLVTSEVPLIGSMDPRLRPSGSVTQCGEFRRSASVRALLVHLESVGFDGSPRYLGVDDNWTGGRVLDRGRRAAPAVPGLGDDRRRALRPRCTHSTAPRSNAWLHPAASPSTGRPTGRTRRPRPVACTPAFVICHNDLFPENVVFRDGRPVALIDFAMAAPGRPLWDVAIAAEVWGPLGDPSLARSASGWCRWRPPPGRPRARLRARARSGGRARRGPRRGACPLGRQHPGRDRRGQRRHGYATG